MHESIYTHTHIYIHMYRQSYDMHTPEVHVTKAVLATSASVAWGSRDDDGSGGLG